jgi:ubiquinone/menaquinone biosynthesis C-methylase UbiE
VGNIDNQQKALSEIHRILKPGGVYLMCENFLTGLESINDARGRVGLDKIQTRWHNNYIDDKLFKTYIKTKFELIEEDHFASTYYLLTRVVKAWICKGNGEEPEYDDDFNKMSSKLSAVGKFSPMRLYLLKKLE